MNKPWWYRAGLLLLVAWGIVCAEQACFHHQAWAEFNLICLALGWYLGRHG